MSRSVSYDALAPRERSIADAFAAGDVWSPQYFADWVRKRSGPEQESIRMLFAGDDPDKAVALEAKKPVPATLIRQLLFKMVTDNQGCPISVDERGAQMRGAIIRDELELSAVEFRKPVIFEDCVFESPINIQDAKLGRVSLKNSTVPGLKGDMVDVDSDLSLEGLKGCQQIDLTRAHITGTLSLDRASLCNTDGVSLSCNGAHVLGSIWMREKFKATGLVDLVCTSISGRLDCTDGHFSEAREGSGALDCYGATVGADVFLCGGFTATGQVHLRGAKIGGELSCENGKFKVERGVALDCDGVSIDGDLLLNYGFEAIGTVDFSGANVGGLLSCDAGVFDGRGGESLVCEGAKIGGSAFLRSRFEARGTVNFIRTVITGNLQLQQGTFDDGEDADAKGWAPELSKAIDMEGARISGTLFLTQVSSFKGGLDLQDAHATRVADDGSIRNNRPHWFARTSSRLLTNIGIARQTQKRKAILIDRLSYDSFAGDYDGSRTDLSAKARLTWLEMQPNECWGDDFRPQPFTQCAKVLRSMGYTKDARLILFERERRRLRHKNTWAPERWVKSFFLGLFAGYGYKTHRAFTTLFVIWLVGAGIFHLEGQMGLMRVGSDNVLASDWYVQRNLQPPDYERFKPALFSLDVLLPVIDFGQERIWIPDDPADRIPGFERILPPLPDMAWSRMLVSAVAWFPKVYYWFEITAGWFLTTIIIAGFTGVLGNQREE